jgi:hypothetical protein
VVVVSVDYSLSPEAKFSCALEECAAVIGHLAEYCSGWNVDRQMGAPPRSRATMVVTCTEAAHRPVMLGPMPFRLVANPGYGGSPTGSPSHKGFLRAKNEITSWHGLWSDLAAGTVRPSGRRWRAMHSAEG